jgi:hypothetical protein
VKESTSDRSGVASYQDALKIDAFRGCATEAGHPGGVRAGLIDGVQAIAGL